MDWLRVSTGVILTAVISILLAAPLWVTLIAAHLIILLACWEWTGFYTRDRHQRAWHLLAYAGLYALLVFGVPAAVNCMLASVCWSLAFVLLFDFIKHQRIGILTRHKLVYGLVGGMWLLPSWSCVGILLDTQPQLLWLAILITVSADVGAYYAGRRWGRKRLMPAVSPGKTVAGALGGLCMAVLCTIVFCVAIDGAIKLSLHWAIFYSMCVAVVSMLGDLFESALKRHCDLKDSGTWFPGHGGLLDRIDGHLAAIPCMTMIALLNKWIVLS